MEKFFFELNGEKLHLSEPEQKGREILEKAGLEPGEDYELLKKVNKKGFEPIQLDELVDLRDPGIESFFAKPYKKIIITIDGHPFEIENCFSTPNKLLTIAGKSPKNFFLTQRIGDREIGYRDDPDHRVSIKNGQKFYSFLRTITIYVNATPEQWERNSISFEEVIQLAFPKAPYGANTEFQVLYSDARDGKDGRLVVGQSVEIINGTKFDVTATDKS